MMYNETNLDTLCAALAEIMGIPSPAKAAPACASLVSFAEKELGGGKADRVFMYNPDAIAQWIEDKYPGFMPEIKASGFTPFEFQTVMPSVTPVCFGTMYTGAQPSVHGIMRYEKPVIKLDSLFDALIRSGKRAAIVAESSCSLAKIFLERDMDYFIYDTVPEVNAKAAELIIDDRYDFICVYNGNYDTIMHKYGPESPEALAEMRLNSSVFASFVKLIKDKWSAHNTLIGFAMDHGCHEIDGACGSHGLYMPEDLNIRHYYGVLRAH